MSTCQPFAFPFSLEILNTSNIPARPLPPPNMSTKFRHSVHPTSLLFFSWHLQVNQLELTKPTYQLLLIRISNQAQSQNSIFK